MHLSASQLVFHAAVPLSSSPANQRRRDGSSRHVTEDQQKGSRTTLWRAHTQCLQQVACSVLDADGGRLSWLFQSRGGISRTLLSIALPVDINAWQLGTTTALLTQYAVLATVSTISKA